MNVSDEHIEAKLIDFAYGELPPGEVAFVQRHLDQCAQCSKAFSDLQGVRRAMSKLPVESASTDGVESLLTYARKSTRRKRVFHLWPMRWTAPLGIAAALALVTVVAVQIDRRGRVKIAPASETESLEPAPSARLADSRKDERRQNKIESPVPEDQEITLGAQPSSPAASEPPVARKTASAESKGVVGAGAASGAASSGSAGPARAFAVPPGKPRAERVDRAVAEGRDEAQEAPLGAKAKAEDSARPAAKVFQKGPAASPAESVQYKDESSEKQASRWIERALHAKQSGDRFGEATYLLRALATPVEGAQLREVLAKLCDAQKALGSAQGVRESCGRLVREFPETREARVAEATLRRFFPTTSSPMRSVPASEPKPQP